MQIKVNEPEQKMIETTNLRLPSLPSQLALRFLKIFAETVFYLLLSTVVKFQFWGYRSSEFTKHFYGFIFSIPTSKRRKSNDFLHFFRKGFI